MWEKHRVMQKVEYLKNSLILHTHLSYPDTSKNWDILDLSH